MLLTHDPSESLADRREVSGFGFEIRRSLQAI